MSLRPGLEAVKPLLARRMKYAGQSDTSKKTFMMDAAGNPVRMRVNVAQERGKFQQSCYRKIEITQDNCEKARQSVGICCISRHFPVRLLSRGLLAPGPFVPDSSACKDKKRIALQRIVGCMRGQ